MKLLLSLPFLFIAACHSEPSNVAPEELTPSVEVETIEAKESSSTPKPVKKEKVEIQLEGRGQVGPYILSLVSVQGPLLEQHFITTSTIPLNTESSTFDELEKQCLSIERISPCGSVSSDMIQLNEVQIFGPDAQTIHLTIPECSDQTRHVFIELKDGVLGELFTFISNSEVEFKPTNDSIFITNAGGSDEIVSAMQWDYQYVYNNQSNKLSFVKPSKQQINFISEALVPLHVYETIEAASEEDQSMLIFVLQPNDSFALDTLYRDHNALLIYKGDSTGYLNTDNLNYETITYNTAG